MTVDGKHVRTGGARISRFQELKEHAEAGARVSEISSHDPRGDVARAAIEYANMNELGGGGHWLNELRGTSLGERFRFLADAFASNRITEATSYFDGLTRQWKFHIGFWYLSGATGNRHDCVAHFETDVKRAISHANEKKELKDATNGLGNVATPKKEPHADTL